MKLTESQLRQIVRESAKKVLSEINMEYDRKKKNESIIRLSSSDFRKFITESVKNVINEMQEETDEYNTGLRFEKAKEIYYKMLEKGQVARAAQFWKQFNDNANRATGEDGKYTSTDWVENGLYSDYKPNGNIKFTLKTDDNNAISGEYRKDGGAYRNDDTVEQDKNFRTLRTTNAGNARRMADNVKAVNPETKLTKQDFRM